MFPMTSEILAKNVWVDFANNWFYCAEIQAPHSKIDKNKDATVKGGDEPLRFVTKSGPLVTKFGLYTNTVFGCFYLE